MSVERVAAKPRCWHFRPLHAGLAGFLTGLFFWGLDCQRLAPREPEDFDALAVLLARCLPLATLFGLGLALLGPALEILRRLLAPLERRRDLGLAFLLALLALPFTLAICRQTLAGAGISQHAQIEVYRLLAPVVLTLVLALGLRLALALESWLSGRPAFVQLSLGLALVVLAYVLERADARLYVGLYPQLHTSLFAAYALTAVVGFALLLAPLRSLRWPALIAALCALLLGWHALRSEASPHSRFLLIKKTTQGPRVVQLWKQFRPKERSFRDAVVADADFAARRLDAQEHRLALRSEVDGFLAESRPQHLIWITVDTLRRDAVGFMGRERNLSPHLDALAAESLVLARHQSQFPITSFSFQSTFFSRYPSATPLFRQMNQVADRPVGSRSLAQELSAAGFRTVSIPAIATRSLEVPAYAVLAHGFDEVDPGANENRGREAPLQLAVAERVLEGHDERRLFLWLHFMDPHESYVAHPEHHFGTSKRDRYDSEIAFVDAAIGRLMAKLEALGLRDDCLIVFNSDHGEAFGDHDTTFHGTTLYEEQIGVPAFIHLPGAEAARVNLPTGNIDLMPTVLDLLGVESAALMQGQSLAGYFIPDLDARLLPLPFSFAEIPDAIPQMAPANRDRQALVNGPYKLIANGHDDFVELYNLENDPQELVNLASRRPEVVARLLGMIRVIGQESEFINVPQSERSDESFYLALKESLSAGAIPTRCRLIEEHINDSHPAMRSILMARLEDPNEHELIKLVILRRGREVLGADYADSLRDLIANGRALGTVATALDLWREQNLPLAPSDYDRLAELLAQHPQWAWRAALLLAQHGDQRARLVLEPALAFSEFRVSYRSACALGVLGDASVAPTIVAGLLAASGEPELFELALQALAALKNEAGLVPVMAILRDRYVHHRLKSAAIDYFASIPSDLALAGFVQLANGWDPEVGKKIRAVLKERVGPEGVQAIIKAGSLREDILELTRMGRFQAAETKCAEVIASLPSVAASFAFRLLQARLLIQLGRVEAAQAQLAELDLPILPAPVRSFAAALRTQGWSRNYELELLSLKALKSGPLAAGREVEFLARVRNSGAQVIPGGGDWQTPIFRIVAANGEAAGQDFVTALPAPGLSPGEEVELLVRYSVPGEHSAYRLNLRAQHRDGGEIRILDRRDKLEPLPIAASLAAGLDPRALTFVGTEIRDQWLINPAFNRGVLLPDNRVAYLANELDPILMSPYLQNCETALEVTVEFQAEAGRAEAQANFELFWRFDDQPHFLPQQHQEQAIRLDGQSQTLKFRIDPSKGRSARQLRFDFFQEPELVEIERITIRSLD